MKAYATPTEQVAQELPRLGLALSGGGFRAAYFHLGVLARLAERGILRSVEVISTVSGGSIIGALYYLHVKNLLEARPAETIADEDYVAIVEDMADGFDAAVKRNLRANVFVAHPVRNFRLCRLGYTRTNLIGALYEEWMYADVWAGKGPFEHQLSASVLGGRSTPIPMRELVITPAGENAGFDVDAFNTRGPVKGRPHPKLPTLLLNATDLATGHGWRFEAMYMGELDVHDPRSPTAETSAGTAQRPRVADPARDEVDKNTTLARTAYSAMQANHPDQANQLLGTAVASSSAFPGLFRPFEIRNLFRRSASKRVDPKLMDGGAHDNQGVEALLERGCNRLIVSDASGQMADEDQPVTRLPSLLGRANSIYGDRVRELQLTEPLGTIPLVLMHLEKEVPAPVLFVNQNEDADASAQTRFGVNVEVQKLLSRVRTDLDAFTEVESRSLSLDAYKMTDTALADQVEQAQRLAAKLTERSEPVPECYEICDYANGETGEGNWSFNTPKIAAALAAVPSGSYLKQLRASKKQLFKPPMMLGVDRPLSIVLALVTVGGTGAGLYALWRWGTVFSGAWTMLGIVLALLIFALYLTPNIAVVNQIGAFVFDIFFPLLFSFVALLTWPLLKPIAHYGNRLYLWLGEESRLS